MEVPIDTSKMTEQELQFHYFKMHDADNNNKLDGNELIKSLIHWHGKETNLTYFSFVFRQLFVVLVNFCLFRTRQNARSKSESSGG